MSPIEAREIAATVLAQEARALDERRWDDWLALFHPQVEYWVPAWKSQAEPTTDPERELSLIYYSSVQGLRERIQRIRSGKSLSSVPLQRTAHFSSNILVQQNADKAIDTWASFQVMVYDPRTKKQHTFFGSYEMSLEQDGEHWRIRRKKTLVQNDYIPTMMDVYCL